jgi:hypothetical protein
MKKDVFVYSLRFALIPGFNNRRAQRGCLNFAAVPRLTT